MKKDEIRRQIKARKALLSDEEKLSAAERVFSLIENSAAFQLAERILMYHSLPDELCTHAFIDKWHTRKQFYLPRVNGINLEVLPYHQSEMRLGAFCIEEPQGAEITPVDEMELIIVPAIAYDKAGNRVGRGKGYYDRLLQGCHATKIGIGYDFQLIDEIEAEPHDVRVDVVITESRIVNAAKNAKR